MQEDRKKRAMTVGPGCLVVACAAFGYLEVFTKGIDRLPARPCEGAVDRATAAQALPSARR